MSNASKFREKYRIPSARKRIWDYGTNGTYFVTICTKGRVPYFGIIDDDVVETHDPGVETHDHASLRVNDFTRMRTTPLGEAARRCWSAIPDHFPFVQLDAFVVMPDHVHGIVIIKKDEDEIRDWNVNRPGSQSRNLASVIRGFKIGVTMFARENDMEFAWQTRFYDRIIKENDNIDEIRTYIEQNPLQWAERGKHEDY